MKKITCFYLKNCPYCIQAKKALSELIEENPAYGTVTIDWIEESEHPEIIEKYSYNYVPCMFIGNEKHYEACPRETYEKCISSVKYVLDIALEIN